LIYHLVRIVEEAEGDSDTDNVEGSCLTLRGGKRSLAIGLVASRAKTGRIDAY
jgi:hypothetical protein